MINDEASSSKFCRLHTNSCYTQLYFEPKSCRRLGRSNKAFLNALGRRQRSCQRPAFTAPPVRAFDMQRETSWMRRPTRDTAAAECITPSGAKNYTCRLIALHHVYTRTPACSNYTLYGMSTVNDHFPTRAQDILITIAEATQLFVACKRQ